MNLPIPAEKQLLTRKQFLATLGAAAGGLIMSQFLFSPKKSVVSQPNTYGNSNYGNKTV